MQLEIREMLPEDYDQKGYVHWKSWQETYTGLITPEELAKCTLEKCQNNARRWPENTLIATLDGRVVGFVCHTVYRGDDLPTCGEVQAIYILEEAQGLGIGRKLMEAALEKLANYDTIALWVLQGNDHAIGFYQHFGFIPDGVSAKLSIGTELRMLYRRP